MCRGPSEVLYYAGAPMRQMIFWVPTPGHLGLGLSIYSYAGKVSVGFATDACLVPDPEKLVDGFQAELAEMERWTSPTVRRTGSARRQPWSRAETHRTAVDQLADELDAVLKSSVVLALRRGHTYDPGRSATTGRSSPKASPAVATRTYSAMAAIGTTQRTPASPATARVAGNSGCAGVRP